MLKIHLKLIPLTSLTLSFIEPDSNTQSFGLGANA